MDNLIHKLNKVFDNRIRLGIMSILVVNDWVEFKELKSLLNLTDGNLASHISNLEKEKYIEYKKEFIGKKPRTSYKATHQGKKAFEEHLLVLESFIKNNSSST
jgi:DNA-binding HxlR family transcriptional regulator